ncbi:unnamed protein product [Amoebophrya sp. A120]|nr:unnamed protein product [Amoebophrya sp. A120]|eukprot:GSA120T00021839001.1
MISKTMPQIFFPCLLFRSAFWLHFFAKSTPAASAVPSRRDSTASPFLLQHRDDSADQHPAGAIGQALIHGGAGSLIPDELTAWDLDTADRFDQDHALQPEQLGSYEMCPICQQEAKPDWSMFRTGDRVVAAPAQQRMMGTTTLPTAKKVNMVRLEIKDSQKRTQTSVNIHVFPWISLDGAICDTDVEQGVRDIDITKPSVVRFPNCTHVIHEGCLQDMVLRGEKKSQGMISSALRRKGSTSKSRYSVSQGLLRNAVRKEKRRPRGREHQSRSVSTGFSSLEESSDDVRRTACLNPRNSSSPKARAGSSSSSFSIFTGLRSSLQINLNVVSSRRTAGGTAARSQQEGAAQSSFSSSSSGDQQLHPAVEGDEENQRIKKEKAAVEEAKLLKAIDTAVFGLPFSVAWNKVYKVPRPAPGRNSPPKTTGANCPTCNEPGFGVWNYEIELDLQAFLKIVLEKNEEFMKRPVAADRDRSGAGPSSLFAESRTRRPGRRTGGGEERRKPTGGELEEDLFDLNIKDLNLEERKNATQEQEDFANHHEDHISCRDCLTQEVHRHLQTCGCDWLFTREDPSPGSCVALGWIFPALLCVLGGVQLNFMHTQCTHFVHAHYPVLAAGAPLPSDLTTSYVCDAYRQGLLTSMFSCSGAEQTCHHGYGACCPGCVTNLFPRSQYSCWAIPPSINACWHHSTMICYCGCHITRHFDNWSDGCRFLARKAKTAASMVNHSCCWKKGCSSRGRADRRLSDSMRAKFNELLTELDLSAYHVPELELSESSDHDSEQDFPTVLRSRDRADQSQADHAGRTTSSASRRQARPASHARTGGVGSRSRELGRGAVYHEVATSSSRGSSASSSGGSNRSRQEPATAGRRQRLQQPPEMIQMRGPAEV